MSVLHWAALNSLATGEVWETILELLARVLALHVDLGLLVLLDHSDLLLADRTCGHHLVSL